MTKQIISFSELNFLIKPDILQNIPIALFSQPGTGKSSFLKAYAANELQSKVFTLTMNLIPDKSDLTGVRTIEETSPTGEKQFKQISFPHATLMDAINYANENPNKLTIVFLDEFNRAPQDVVTATMSFTTERKVGNVDFPDNIRFVLAGNLEGNVVTFDSATATRFSIYHIEPDIVTYLHVNPDLNPFVRELVSKNKELLLGGKNTDADDSDFFVGDEEAITEERTNPRTLTMLSNWLNQAGIDKSGTKDEYASLNEFMQTTYRTASNTNPTTLLQVSIEGKIGKTETAKELINSIIRYHEQLTNELAQQEDDQVISDYTDEYLQTINQITPSPEEIEFFQSCDMISQLVDSLTQYSDPALFNLTLWTMTQDADEALRNALISPKMLMTTLKPMVTEMEEIRPSQAKMLYQIIGRNDNFSTHVFNALVDDFYPQDENFSEMIEFAKTNLIA